MTGQRAPDPKRFLLLALLSGLVTGLVFGLLSLLAFHTGRDGLPKWPQALVQIAGLVWAWQKSGMTTALRLRERFGLRWLL